MGVHHAWGRIYKDLFQRFHTMLGEKQRYQNGFDCQGLWIEVEVEKEHGFTSKKDIVDVRRRQVRRGVQGARAALRRQIRPSSRSGSATGWTGTTRYYTNSRREQLHDLALPEDVLREAAGSTRATTSMPWCPRCATGLSEHEIVTEGYQRGHAPRAST